MSTPSGRWQSRLFSVVRDSPHIVAFGEVITGPMDDTEAVMDYILDNTDLDDRTGVGLDAVGWLIGVQRPPAEEVDENLLWLCPLDWMDIEPEKRGLSTLGQTEGGYMTGLGGIPSQSNPGSYMPDDQYRELIKTKAATFRRKATLDNVFTYLQRFGIRATFDEGTAELIITPESFDGASYWKRWYIKNKGFRPAGIKISISDQIYPEEGM